MRMHAHPRAQARFAVVVAGLLLLPASARIIVLGAPAETPREELRAAAATVAAGGAAAMREVRARGFEVKVSESDVLSADLSPSPHGTAYVWSDGSVKMGEGFVVPHGATFESSLGAGAGGVKPPRDRATKFNNALTQATAGAQGLKIAYAVAGPGEVRVRAYGLSGKTLGAWKWIESQAGMRERTLQLRPAALKGGPVWIRWTQGSTSAVRRVRVSDSR